jgi:hypothetical protein
MSRRLTRRNSSLRRREIPETSSTDILVHLGEPTAPPRIAPARGPPLWEQAAAAWVDPRPPKLDPSVQPAPAYELDQRIAR